MKKLIMLLIVLVGILLCQGCTAGSALSLVALSANRLVPAGEQELIQKIKVVHETWHEEIKPDKQNKN